MACRWIGRANIREYCALCRQHTLNHVCDLDHSFKTVKKEDLKIRGSVL
jgi:hypothetical protein